MTKPKKNYAPLVEAANAAAAVASQDENMSTVAWKDTVDADEPVTAVETPVPQHGLEGTTFRGTEAEIRGHARDAQTASDHAKLLADSATSRQDAVAEPWRGTGRTTSMLGKAWDRADKGDSVLVLVPDARMIDTFKQIMPLNARVSVVTPTMAYSLQGQGFDAVFVDHSCWEGYPFETAEFLVAIRPRVRRG